MPKDKVKVALMLAIVFSVVGIYKIGKVSYTALAWEKTNGVITDFQRHTFSCGRQSKCYSLLVAYRANNQVYTVNGEEKFSDPPKHLGGKDVIVYFSPSNPGEATLGGKYSPLDHGLAALGLGIVMFIVYWFSKDRS